VLATIATEVTTAVVAVLALILSAYNTVQQRKRNRRQMAVSCRWAFEARPGETEPRQGLRVRVVNLGPLPLQIVDVGTIHPGGKRATAPVRTGLPVDLGDGQEASVWFEDATEQLAALLEPPEWVYAQEATGARAVTPFPQPLSAPGGTPSDSF
jgi:hypothetical protein